MDIRRCILLTIFCLASFSLFAQIEFTANAPEIVAEGNQFSVSYAVNADGKNFVGPKFQGFQILGGPNPSSSTSVQFINGKMNKSVNLTYTYYLQAVTQGHFEIQPATITVNGKTYKSNALTIKVEKSAPSASQQSKSGKGNHSQGQGTSESVQSGGKDIFIKTYVSNRNPYQGQQTIVTYKLFTKVGISSLQPKGTNTYQGFWMQDLLDQSRQLQQREEVIDGVRYTTAELKKIALFPVRSGEITIEPLEYEILAQYRTQRQSSGDPFFDSFFNMGSIENRQLNIKSDAISLNVKSLPQSNKPISFNGVVGEYTFKSDIDKQQLKTNDAITLKYTVSGTGNVELVELPEINFPPDFEVYPPKVSHNVKNSSSGVSGWKTFEYLIIPRAAGTFSIPEMNFSFFNPATQNYATLTAPAYNIEVEKGSENDQTVSYSAVRQEDIKYIGNDVRHIKIPPFELQQIGNHVFGTIYFYAIIAGSLVLFILILILTNKMRKKHGNLALMRNKKATKIARSRLKKGLTFLKANQPDAFFEENTQALWGYLSDKFTIQRSELSKETVEEVLREKAVNEEFIKEIVGILDDCEFARYAPGDKQHDMEKIYNDSLNVISKIEQNLR
ncbi:MAG: BatD family protein [Bacteroidales bacterium]|nr:BatD family protein [Bacteroidales bacterium]